MWRGCNETLTKTENTNMDDGHVDGHDDGAESIGSRVTLWLILHAFILSKSVLASETF